MKPFLVEFEDWEEFDVPRHNLFDAIVDAAKHRPGPARGLERLLEPALDGEYHAVAGINFMSEGSREIVTCVGNCTVCDGQCIYMTRLLISPSDLSNFRSWDKIARYVASGSDVLEEDEKRTSGEAVSDWLRRIYTHLPLDEEGYDDPPGYYLLSISKMSNESTGQADLVTAFAWFDIKWIGPHGGSTGRLYSIFPSESDAVRWRADELAIVSPNEITEERVARHLRV